MIDALSESGLEIQRSLHLKAHQDMWVGNHPEDHLLLFKGRYQDRDGTWKDWNDADWLSNLKISADIDMRSPSDLARRYKKEAKGEDNGPKTT